NSLVEKVSSSDTLYTPDGTGFSISRLMTKVRLSTLRKERWFSKAAKGKGSPFFAKPNNKLRFPLLPGPWIIQGRKIYTSLSGGRFDNMYCSASNFDLP